MRLVDRDFDAATIWTTWRKQAILFLVCFCALAGVALPPREAWAACGMGNQCAVVDSLTPSSNPAPAGQTIDLTCQAHDPDGVITRFTFSADGGTFSNGLASIDVYPAVQQTPSSETTTWNVPNTPGTSYTLTCVAWDNGGFMGIPTQSAPLSIVVPVEAAAQPPVITSLSAVPAEVYVGEASIVTADAYDPGGGPLTYQWTANGGTLTGDADADPWVVTWTAPATTGTYSISLTVTNPGGQQAGSSVPVVAVWAKTSGVIALSRSDFYPERIAIDSEARIFVADPVARTITSFSPMGELLRVVPMAGKPSGIAAGASGVFYVGDRDRGRVGIFDAAFVETGFLGKGDGEFLRPVDVAADAVRGRVYVADGAAGVVKAYTVPGAPLFSIATGGSPVALAVAAGSGEVFVGESTGGVAKVYAADGSFSRTLGGFGGGAGEITRVAGLALSPDGSVCIVDAYQSRVTIFTAAGAFIGTVGVYGDAPGELRVPLGATFDAFRRLLVANSNNARVDRFDLASSLPPVCQDDADCDGMPDWWEIQNGFDPNNPADAWLDADGDGLANVLEYKHGTDPHNADTDADGVSDGDEVNNGTDPKEPSDNVPVANAGVDQVTKPARVTLDGGGSHDPNFDHLVFAWVQDSGPAPLTVNASDTAAPWVVARKAGQYVFSLRVNDGRVWSVPSTVTVTVEEVAPDADAGPPLGGTVAFAVSLDGRFSTDANGDALTYAWTQTTGPAITLSAGDTARPSFIPNATGVHRFDLVVNDGTADSAPSGTFVVVNAPFQHCPTAVTPARIIAQVGGEVFLDGGASLDADGDSLSFSWAQTGGPVVALTGADSVTASFLPTVAGVYAFELLVSDGANEGVPSATTAVVGDPAGNTPPSADAGNPQRAAVFETVSLRCDWSFDPDGDPIDCVWTQTEGVRAPRTVRSVDLETFSPIGPGSYGFELSVGDPSGPGTRDRTMVVVDDPEGNHVPVAAPAVEGTFMVAEPLTLRGDDSRDADNSGALGYVWTQVAGPQGDMTDARAMQAVFTPLLPGLYAFELRVDDGAARSAPGRLEFAVSSPANQPPVASAGPDLLVAPGSAAILDGSWSSDPEGQPLTYQWTQTAGPLNAVVTGADTARLSVNPPLSGFTLSFTLSVADGELFGIADTVNLNVADVPLALTTFDAAGGQATVSAPGNAYDGTVLSVPAGALPGPVAVALGEISRPWYAESGRVPYGTAIFLGPVGALFAQPVSLRTPLDPQPLVAAGVPAADVRVVRFDHDAGTWSAVPSAVVDLGAGTVTIPATKPGVFQLSLPEGWQDPDAYNDPDRDGLVNIDEKRFGTDPDNPDTDGDGVTDGQEVARGTDPTNPADNRPVASAGADIVTTPGRVVLDGRASSDPNGDPLTFEWTQSDGAATVTLRDAGTARPWFVVRTAGAYRFALRVSDGRAWSPAAPVQVTVENVPPTADPGPSIGGAAGAAVSLDGRFSTDANGDGLAFSWTQTAGPAVALADADTATPSFQPIATGVYAFDLVVGDGALLSAAARTSVVVDSPDDHVPTAAAAVAVAGSVGATITLDGSASVDPDGKALGYSWRQTGGPAAALDGAGAAMASFVPAAPGVYTFDLTVNDGVNDSPPATAVVSVGGPGNNPPVAEAGFDQRAAVLEDVFLHCDWSHDPDGQPIDCAWTQVEGVRVTLFSPPGGPAKFTPIDPGTCAFELSVSDPDGNAAQDRVTVVVDDPDGNAVPAAAAAVAGARRVREQVTLSAAGSRDADAGDSLEYTWTQVGGPRAILSDVHAAAPVFTPLAAGSYAFDLRADDGMARSPAARVAFAVSGSENLAPTAVAPRDFMTPPGAAAGIDGSGSSDPEGAPLAYRWTQTGGPRNAPLDGADRAALTVTPSISGFTLAFSLVVSDGRLESAPAPFNLSVADVPLARQDVDAAGGAIPISSAGNPFDGASIAVPPGAVGGTLTIVAGEITRDWFSAKGRTPWRSALFVGPVGVPFAKPFELTIPFNGAALLGKNVQPSSVEVVTFDYDAAVWVRVTGAIIDLGTGIATIPSANPGVYQLSLPEGWDVTVEDGGAADDATADAGSTFDVSNPSDVSDDAGTDGGTTDDGTMDARPEDRGTTPQGDGGRDEGSDSAEATSDAAKDDLAVIDGPGFIESNGCGCSTVGDSRSPHKSLPVLLAFAFVAFVLMRPGATQMRRRARILLVLAAVVFISLFSGISSGTDAPHDPTTPTFNQGCEGCHTLHNNPNLALTNVAGNANLCINCHATKGMSWAPAQQAVPGSTGTSHRWDAPATNTRYGATPPAQAGMSVRLDNGKLMCSTCHDQHSQSATPFDPTASKRHFLRTTGDGGALCAACHSSWVMDHTAAETWDNTYKSHPVGVTLNANAKGYDRTAPLDANGAAQGSPGEDANPTNNLKLDSGGRVHCQSCHGMHYADGNALTEDKP
ncbi:MAG: hypothetical protein HY897_11480 [Deltaproteobacteria bacterium]|nr:hypothetical protein [Deltaproteobacteria bacterium]